jgi:hypothetical protein
LASTRDPRVSPCHRRCRWKPTAAHRVRMRHPVRGGRKVQRGALEKCSTWDVVKV